MSEGKELTDAEMNELMEEQWDLVMHTADRLSDLTLPLVGGDVDTAVDALAVALGQVLAYSDYDEFNEVFEMVTDHYNMTKEALDNHVCDACKDADSKVTDKTSN